jgi:hypothetical protein
VEKKHQNLLSFIHDGDTLIRHRERFKRLSGFDKESSLLVGVVRTVFARALSLWERV